MSLSIPLAKLKEEDIEMMEKKLYIELKPKTRSKFQQTSWRPPEKINIVHKEEENVMVPFAWGCSYFGKKYRPARSHCATLYSRFHGTLREEQEDIFRETIQSLNQCGTALMAIYPGGGKCLAKGTRLRCYDGSVKNVEDIVIGDVLHGDDHLPRRVLSICRGRETMYQISRKYTSLIDYSVNESHILTVYDTINRCIIDLPLVELLRRDPTLRRYEGVYFDYHGPSYKLDQKRKELAEKILLMGSDIIPNDLVEDVMLCGCVWEPYDRQHITLLDVDHVLLHRTQRVVQTYPLSITKQGEDDYFGFTITGNHRFLLHNGICTHNTVTSLSIASTIGLRTMIFVNKLVLIDQWLETIYQAFGKTTNVQVIQGGRSKIRNGCDFYIVNAINVKKHSFEEYSQLNIGLLIVDECHLMMTRIFSQALSYVTPRYLIGLSATPFRLDGYDLLLELYFGLHRVIRKLYRPHTIYCIDSMIKIDHDRDMRGDIIWNSVIDKQTCHKERNQKIAELCKKYSDRNILILSKRIKQIEEIYSMLEGEHVTMMKENENTFDTSARILIATFQKVGTGFSHNKLDMLILASDTEEYFIQYLGRVFRRPDVQPIVIDIVDRHPILKRHFKSRKDIYEKAGGSIHYLEKL